jgi:pyruvate kinase
MLGITVVMRSKSCTATDVSAAQLDTDASIIADIPPPFLLSRLQTEALATAAVRAATKLQAKLIVVFTVTGRTARLIAKYRPQQPILTVRCLTALAVTLLFSSAL